MISLQTSRMAGWSDGGGKLTSLGEEVGLASHEAEKVRVKVFDALALLHYCHEQAVKTFVV